MMSIHTVLSNDENFLLLDGFIKHIFLEAHLFIYFSSISFYVKCTGIKNMNSLYMHRLYIYSPLFYISGIEEACVAGSVDK